LTRQQYIAELGQLLFYMTPWDKAAALEKYSKLFEESENEAALFNELGSPMKLAVTLNRSYEPTLEPTAQEEAESVQEEVPEEVTGVSAEEEPAAEECEEVVEAEESAAEEPEEEAAEEEPAAEPTTEDVQETAEPAEEAEVEAEMTEAVEEAPEAEESAEEVPAEEESSKEISEEMEMPAEESRLEEEQVETEEHVETEEEPEAAEEEPAAPAPLETKGEAGKEKIFSEIYSAATDAQSAVVIEESAVGKTVRKARYLFLIPYTILSVLVAIPVVAVLAVVNVVLFAAAIVCLCACLYLVILQLPGALGLGNQLIYGGLAIVTLAITIGLGGLGVWFADAATAGFPRFLLGVAKKYGYREVEVQ